MSSESEQPQSAKNKKTKKCKVKAKKQLPQGTSGTPLFEDIKSLGWKSSPEDVAYVNEKYSFELSALLDHICDTYEDNAGLVHCLKYVSNVLRLAWKVPSHGHQVGGSLCETFMKQGGLELLIENLSSTEADLRVISAQLLEQSMTPDNCNYVVGKGYGCVGQIVKVASELCESGESHIGTGLLRHLFRHSEATCSRILQLQGLEVIMAECKRMDVETLRNCAEALANLSLFGGTDNQEKMIKQKSHLWLFPLGFHGDDSVKYYACIAIAVLVTNREIEAEIIQSNTLQLVSLFLASRNPQEFASSHFSDCQGQTTQWLEKLVPVLSSSRNEASSLATFHFCMEAGVKKLQGLTSVFKEISAIKPLIQVASSPNAIASKLAAQALILIGETVPHKLSQQVPLWSPEDVREWVIQKGFAKYTDSFMASGVDGDLLLRLTEDMLRDDIRMENAILRNKFMRELKQLMKMADYSSCDSSNLNDLLRAIHPEFCMYTYTLLNNNIDKEILLKCVSDESLAECGVTSYIHRNRILETLRVRNSLQLPIEGSLNKPLDVFISYRRSNGSHLASLLKAHLTLRGFSVFIDVERLDSGKFDVQLLRSIRKARHFLLCLTPNALDRCIGDSTDNKDWIHKEIVAALEFKCNIVPIMDNFVWPEQLDRLPEDMKDVQTFNGVNWIHEYQDACMDKIERFLTGSLPHDSKAGKVDKTPSIDCGAPECIREPDDAHGGCKNPQNQKEFEPKTGFAQESR